MNKCFDGDGFYNFASELYNNANHNEKAKIRTIISRAYYGAFLDAKEKAGFYGIVGGVHRKTIEFYERKDKKISEKLKDLMFKRESADYDLTKDLHKRDAGLALKLSKELIELLKA